MEFERTRCRRSCRCVACRAMASGTCAMRGTVMAFQCEISV